MRLLVIENKTTKLLLMTISLMAVLSLGVNEAYADIPNIDTFVADDPDNGDTVYSVDDTFTLTFSLPINVTAGATMSQGAIDGNFTLSGGTVFGTTYSGLWSGDRLTLTITVNTVGAPNPVIGGTTVSAAGTSNLGHAGDPPTSLTLTGAPTLSGDYGILVTLTDSGGGCRGDCTSPTLGVSEQSIRLVENGFSYNGNPVDVEYFYTPYPLITTKVGVENKAEFRIYENGGTQNIKHFALAFGLGKGQYFGESKAVIAWDKSHDGKETLTITDPENALQNVRVEAAPGPCKPSFVLSTDCLIVTVYHTFRESLEFNMVSTDVWDYRLNSWQNYYNDGVEVQGESLNPPAQYVGIYQGHLVTITETDKNTAIDEDGNTWTLDKTWTRDYIPTKKIVDGVSTKWIDRNNAWIDTYKKGQELLANEILEDMLYGKLKYWDSLDEPKTHYTEFIKRSEDHELQQALLYENYKAYQIFKQITDLNRNH